MKINNNFLKKIFFVALFILISTTKFASSEIINQLVKKIVATDILENVEAFEKLLNEHRDILLFAFW